MNFRWMVVALSVLVTAGLQAQDEEEGNVWRRPPELRARFEEALGDIRGFQTQDMLDLANQAAFARRKIIFVHNAPMRLQAEFVRIVKEGFVAVANNGDGVSEPVISPLAPVSEDFESNGLAALEHRNADIVGVDATFSILWGMTGHVQLVAFWDKLDWTRTWSVDQANDILAERGKGGLPPTLMNLQPLSYLETLGAYSTMWLRYQAGRNSLFVTAVDLKDAAARRLIFPAKNEQEGNPLEVFMNDRFSLLLNGRTLEFEPWNCQATTLGNADPS